MVNTLGELIDICKDCDDCHEKLSCYWVMSYYDGVKPKDVPEVFGYADREKTIGDITASVSKKRFGEEDE